MPRLVQYLLAIALMVFAADSICGQGIPGANNFLNLADKQFERSVVTLGDVQSAEHKSEGRALFYSLVSTAVPIGIGALSDDNVRSFSLAFGVAVGPSIGIAYGDDLDRAALGTGIRAAGVGIAAIGGIFHLLDSFSDDSGLTTGDILITGGLSLTGFSMIYDIFSNREKLSDDTTKGLIGSRLKSIPG
ncbi:hypothetical protein [Rhodohalobacter sp. 8-1]|uniref:hypothetical protein n=1 Tax=Rhodohalobacter sp. 8-1 TaxID=3131972 RepID=UPI0030EBE3DB